MPEEPGDSEGGETDEHSFDQGGRNEVEREERDRSRRVPPDPFAVLALSGYGIHHDQVKDGEDRGRHQTDCDEGEGRPPVERCHVQSLT